MLRFLFPRLTAEPERGVELFAWITTQARAPHWYRDGGVADTVDGRFAILATITALVSVRLERAGDASVALTERFIQVMEAEHREMGVGDPKLGRTVRKLVGALARRIELWRLSVADGDWNGAVQASVYGDIRAPAKALLHSARGLRALWDRLETTADGAIAQGIIA
jgi:cytochrome b pre-mRNA-processing protein 3